MEPLLALVLLACPVGMGLMMWFMMRGRGRHESHSGGDSLTDLKAEQARLAEKIEVLGQDRTAAALAPQATAEQPAPADVR